MKKGFTLVELITAVAIIGILATVVTVRLTGQKASARDARRKADLKEVQTALELYKVKNGSYPVPGVQCGPVDTAGTNKYICGEINVNVYTGTQAYVPNLAPDFISRLPSDPARGKTCSNNPGGNEAAQYMYFVRQDGSDYKFRATCNEASGATPLPPSDPFRDPSRAGYAVYSSGGGNL